MLRAILFVLTVYPFVVFGCSCTSEHKSFKESLVDYDSIFIGIVQNTDMTPGDWSSSFYKTEMKVQKIWKGEKKRRSLFIKTSTEQSSCGAPAPQIGHTFLVFANKSKDGFFVTGGCALFVDLDQVKMDLKELNKEEKNEFEAMFAEIWVSLGEPIAEHNE